MNNRFSPGVTAGGSASQRAPSRPAGFNATVATGCEAAHFAVIMSRERRHVGAEVVNLVLLLKRSNGKW